MARDNRITLGQTNLAILKGDIDLSVWSDEELLRGQRRGRNGRWQGRKPKVVPKAVHDEWVRRKFAKSYELMQSSLVAAVQELCELATNAEDENVRLKAIDLLLRHTLPSKPEHLTITLQPKPYERVERVLVDRDLGDDVIDVQSFPDDGDDERF